MNETKLNRLYASEQEQSVLGALLIDNDAIDKIGDLRSEHFYDSTNRRIFEVIIKFIAASKSADVITVFTQLQTNGSDAADIGYLHALTTSMPSSANIARYAGIVHDRAIKRGLITLGREIEEMAEGAIEESNILVDRISSKLERLAQATVKDEPILVSDDLVAHIESIDARYNGSEPDAISTGFIDLDKKLNGGLRRGNLIILAARPKMGKSALALNIACHVAIGGVAGVLSMEMTKSELHDRNIANIGRIHLDHLIDPKKMTDDDWPRLTHAVQQMTTRKLYLDQQPGLSIMQVRAKAKQIKRKAGLDLLVIDYLQLMSGDGDNRNAQIESITRGLKNLAKELNIAIILLSQLNRKLEDRPNKRPQPADLRDSGSIEQDADIAIFLYRDEVYNEDSMNKGVCEANIALSRQGAPGIVPLAYIGEQTRFENLSRSWHPEPPKTQPRRNRGFDE